MEILQQWCKMRFSFRNATIIVCFCNLITVLLLLQGFLSASSTRKLAANQPNSVQLKYFKESEELRRAMEPLELIKRVREIQQEVYLKPEAVEQKETKQATAVDLISRLNNFRSYTDSGSMKVMEAYVRKKFQNRQLLRRRKQLGNEFLTLEEWRKRKMERARQRELGKNGTATSQA